MQTSKRPLDREHTKNQLLEESVLSVHSKYACKKILTQTGQADLNRVMTSICCGHCNLHVPVMMEPENQKYLMISFKEISNLCLF